MLLYWYAVPCYAKDVAFTYEELSKALSFVYIILHSTFLMKYNSSSNVLKAFQKAHSQCGTVFWLNTWVLTRPTLPDIFAFVAYQSIILWESTALLSQNAVLHLCLCSWKSFESFLKSSTKHTKQCHDIFCSSLVSSRVSYVGTNSLNAQNPK